MSCQVVGPFWVFLMLSLTEHFYHALFYIKPLPPYP